MDHNNMQNGYGPQSNGLSQAGHSHQTRLRVPTVNEALPYSPFGSIVPFNPDLITPPMALPATTPTAFEDSDDIKAAQRDLQRLAAAAESSESAKKRYQKTLNDVKKLLDPESLTQFRFKTSKRRREGEQNGEAKETNLTSFAKMVYDNTSVDFQYMTPEKTPESDDNIVVKTPSQPRFAQPQIAQPKATQAQKAASKASKQTAQPRPAQVQVGRRPPSHPQQAPQPRLAQVQIAPGAAALPRPSSQQNGYSSQQQATPSTSHATPKAFVLPTTLTPAQRAEYQKVSIPEGRDSTPTKNQSAYLTNGARTASLDQRHKADASVETLQSLIQAIFEAEDQMQPDTSGVVSMQTNNFFATDDADEGDVPVLTGDAQASLDSAVLKVYGCHRLDDIETEHLGRVQKLCESSMAAAESKSLHIGEDWGEQDVLDWLARVSGAQKGLLAARTLTRIMIRCTHRKELQSEDFLRAVLDAVRSAIETCIIPITEVRPSMGERTKGGREKHKDAPRNPQFDIVSENSKALKSFVSVTVKCLRLVGDLFEETNVDESSISSLEYLCKTLIFTDSGSEKDSALGTSTFENLRVAAMDVLASIFAKYIDQRSYIFDELLTSLDKLPATKQSARQFSIQGSKNVQLVSALLMRLVQTSACDSLKNNAVEDEDDEEEGEDSEEESEVEDSDDSETITVTKKKKAAKKKKRQAAKAQGQSKNLAAVYRPLQEAARKHAGYIIQMLLHRALTTSKSSEEPFRRLLDIFVEDFLNILGHPDWPAAELLLRVLVGHMVSIAENPKSPAPSRTLALELLSTIGTGILDIQTAVASTGRAIDTEDPVSRRLADMARLVESGSSDTSALTSYEGPYRVVLEYLHLRDIETPQLQSARGYHLMQWADFLCNAREESVGPSDSPSFQLLQMKIRRMIQDINWLEENSDFPRPSTTQGNFAGKLVAANSPLCKAFAKMFSVVLASLTSEQPTVRSRSLKSVTTLLEKDPSVLDRNQHILAQIIRCLGDASSLVRDSALGLVQKCVSLRPKLELKVYERVIPRTYDTAVGVRKRSMAFLKQVYLRNDDNAVRAAICNALISRINDIDESVAEVAKATIEEIWFSAFRGARSYDDCTVEERIDLCAHAVLIIQTVELGDNVATVLESLISKLLTTSKQASENVRICKTFVEVLKIGVVNPKDLPGEPSRESILRTMNVFAKAGSSLFTPDQLMRMESYTNNLQTSADLELFNFTVSIMRHTLPVVNGVSHELLEKLLSSCFSSCGKVGKTELSMIAPCVATIDGIFGGTERVPRFVFSAVDKICDMRRGKMVANESNAKKVTKLIMITGSFGKACNLDAYVANVKGTERYSWFKGSSAAALLVEIACYFTSPKQPLTVRQAAIEAACEIAQVYPDEFSRQDLINAIETVFKDKEPSLESALLNCLETFFAIGVAGGQQQEAIAGGIEGGAQRLGGTYKATGHDTASSSLAQRFMPDFLRIALSSFDEVALAAARIVVHINTTGNAFPSTSGPSLIALETCPTTVIAKLAFMAHKEQFSKYETVFSQLLTKAVQKTFDYQVNVAKSPSGCTGSPPTSKLHFFWDVTKTGKPKMRQKFFENLNKDMSFDPAKLVTQNGSSPHLHYVRFCLENLAFFEYHQTSDVLHLLSCLEKTVAGTGTGLAQAIESDVLKLRVPMTSPSTANDSDNIAVAGMDAAPVVSSVDLDPKRLEQMAVSAQILSLIWETRSYLRRVWTMQRYAGKPKLATKEAGKAPSRASNAAALTEAFTTRVSNLMNVLTTEDSQKDMCNSFVELISVDTEVKVGEDDEDNMDLDMEDDDDARSEGSSAKSPSAAPRGKKRKSIDGAGGPAKKPRGRPRKSSVSKQKMDDDDEGGWD